MHSNFITPPDFVDEPLPSITIINATLLEVEMMAKMCQESDEQYNIYLYRSEMNDMDWLYAAINRSEAVVLNTIDPEFDHIMDMKKTYFYGDRVFVTDRKQLASPLHFFLLRKTPNK
jgi:hypothetical protein